MNHISVFSLRLRLSFVDASRRNRLSVCKAPDAFLSKHQQPTKTTSPRSDGTVIPLRDKRFWATEELQCFVYAEILLKLKQTRRSLAIVRLPGTDLDIEMRRVKDTLRGLNPTLLRVKGHRDLTDPILTLAGSDPGTLQGRAIRVLGLRAGSRVP
jgi:hypothetical protein